MVHFTRSHRPQGRAEALWERDGAALSCAIAQSGAARIILSNAVGLAEFCRPGS